MPLQDDSTLSFPWRRESR